VLHGQPPLFPLFALTEQGFGLYLLYHLQLDLKNHILLRHHHCPFALPLFLFLGYRETVDYGPCFMLAFVRPSSNCSTASLPFFFPYLVTTIAPFQCLSKRISHHLETTTNTAQQLSKGLYNQRHAFATKHGVVAGVSLGSLEAQLD